MLTSEQLKNIRKEARPLIEQQLELAEKIAGFRELVSSHGGDWGQLKALIKAQIQDENDDEGDGKRVRKILDKADYANAYADMLGLAKMNKKNSFVGDDEDEPAPSDPKPETQAADAEGEGMSLASSSATHQPETATKPDHTSKSTAARDDAGNTGVTAGETAPDHQSAPGKTGEATASPAPSNVTEPRPAKKQWKHSDPAHRDCLNPSGCGGFSNLGLCQPCREAAAGGQVA